MSSVDARDGSVPIIPESKVVRITTTEGQHGPLGQIARFTHGLAAKIAGRFRPTTSTAEVDPIALHFTADRGTINILPGSAPDKGDATGVGREFVTNNPYLLDKSQYKANKDETNSPLADQMRTLAALPNPTPPRSNLNLDVMPPSDSSSPAEHQPRSLLMEPIVGILPTKDGARTVKGQKLSISDTNYQVQYRGSKTHLVSKEGDVTAQISYPDTNSSFTTYVQMEGRDGSQVWVKIGPDGAMQVLQNGKIEQKSLIHTHTLRPNQSFRATVVPEEPSEEITTSAIAHPQEIKPDEFVVEGRIRNVFCVTGLQANDAHRSASQMVELPDFN